MTHGNVHWTANFDEIQDFENGIRGLFGGTGFLSDADFDSTRDPLGNPKAGLSSELDALAAFVSSLTEFPLSPHRNADGTLTADGRSGRQIFVTLGCQICHSPPRFTDGLRHDVGTVEPSSGLGIGQSLDGIGFETPTLRGIWNTSPYFHSGRATSLYEVLGNLDHGDTGGLTASEIDQLIAYLLQIDENSTCGDLNGDGDVNVFDAMIDLQIIVGLIEPTGTQLRLGDVVRDGTINVFDAILLLQRIVGVTQITECGPPAS